MPAPEIAAAALLVREDGRVLLVQHHERHDEFPSDWSLPMHRVRDEEVAEEALERLMRDVLHVEPGPYEFAETVYITTSGGGGYIVNVFTCVEWRGEPRYAETHYADAAWTQPSTPGGLQVQPDVRTFLFQAFEGADEGDGMPGAPGVTGEEVADRLLGARLELLHAFEAIPAEHHTRDLDDGWCPIDVLAHAASVEAYYVSEALQLLTPGHTWRSFNEAQWAADYRTRPIETAEAARARLDATRASTLAWLADASPAHLATFGNHLERGVVTVGERIDKIARHDLEHAGQLQRMREVAQVLGGATHTDH